MTIEEIKKLVVSGESQILELKKTTGELKDGMHSACAFLNSDGGWLIFGVTPKSLKVVGQEVTDNTQREIAQALSGIEPAVYVNVKYIDVPEQSGNKIIAIHFDGWRNGEQPYTFHGCPYYRVESTTRVMPREMYDERVRACRPQRYAWEQQVADNVSVDELNAERIYGSVRLGVEGGRMPMSAMTDSVESLLSKLQLVIDGKPNNAAVMMFANKTVGYPENWGSGVQRIIETCRSQNLREPVWTSDGAFVTVTFKRHKENETSGDTPQVPPKYPLSTDQVPPK